MRGRSPGQIYAISTLGSFIGTFLPTLVTIPAIGTTKTFLLFSLVLLFVALAGLGNVCQPPRNVQAHVDARRCSRSSQ